MAYNIPERYSDLTPAAKLDKKTLNKMVWNVHALSPRSWPAKSYSFPCSARKSDAT